MPNSAGRANGNERKPNAKPRGILASLFKRFSGKPQADSVPSGISRRAMIGGRPSQRRIFRGFR